MFINDNYHITTKIKRADVNGNAKLYANIDEYFKDNGYSVPYEEVFVIMDCGKEKPAWASKDYYRTLKEAVDECLKRPVSAVDVKVGEWFAARVCLPHEKDIQADVFLKVSESMYYNSTKKRLITLNFNCAPDFHSYNSEYIAHDCPCIPLVDVITFTKRDGEPLYNRDLEKLR